MNRYQSELGLCLLFTCKESSDCQTYDKNRVCHYGHCYCRDDFEEYNNNGMKCFVGPDSYGKTCKIETDCQGVNQRCLDKKCRCKSQSRWKEENGTMWCAHFNCKDNDPNVCSDQYDPKQVCNKEYNLCRCEDGYQADEQNGYKCVSSAMSLHNINLVLVISIVVLLKLY